MKTCILIQTCDKYEFLWEGLELAWKLNWDWKQLKYPVFLLTEKKECNSKIFNTIKSEEVYNDPSNFSTRMIAGLCTLKRQGYDTVLYAQDDFWPLFPVKTKVFREAIEWFEWVSPSCLHINEYCSWYEYTMKKTNITVGEELLWKLEVGSRFYYNHQAALWKIDDLLSIQKKGEEPYENEQCGTLRAWEKELDIYFLNYAWYKTQYINDKGSLLPVAKDFVADWKWKMEFDKKTNT